MATETIYRREGNWRSDKAVRAELDEFIPLRRSHSTKVKGAWVDSVAEEAPRGIGALTAIYLRREPIEPSFEIVEVVLDGVVDEISLSLTVGTLLRLPM